MRSGCPVRHQLSQEATAVGACSSFLTGGRMKVAVLGLGYVGTVTAAGLAASGHDVVGVDVDPFKVGCIAAGRSPVVEPGIDELVHEAVSAGRLRATTCLADALPGADVTLICVGTPSASNGGTELRFIERVTADLRQAMESVTP